MPDYQKGKIYKIEIDGHCYVGSTTAPALCCRRCKHVDLSKHNTNTPLYQAINARQSKWNGIHLILVESYPCNSSDELRARERHWIEQLKYNLNVSNPYATEEEQKEWKRQYASQYLEVRKDDPELWQRKKEIYKKHYYSSEGMKKRKEKKHAAEKIYAEKNKDRLKNYRQDWGAKDVECPHCQTTLKQDSLAKHIKRMHPDRIEGGSDFKEKKSAYNKSLV
jgi:endogenous inhibitor of DNA gyrase (YacG/DUF329 family)